MNKKINTDANKPKSAADSLKKFPAPPPGKPVSDRFSMESLNGDLMRVLHDLDDNAPPLKKRK